MLTTKQSFSSSKHARDLGRQLDFADNHHKGNSRDHRWPQQYQQATTRMTATIATTTKTKTKTCTSFISVHWYQSSYIRELNPVANKQSVQTKKKANKHMAQLF